MENGDKNKLFEGYGEYPEVGTVVDTGPTTREEMIEALEEMGRKAKENFGTIPPAPPVHPLFFRDGLIATGYPKDKANKIVLEKAKEQGFSKDDLAELKKNLEK